MISVLASPRRHVSFNATSGHCSGHLESYVGHVTAVRAGYFYHQVREFLAGILSATSLTSGTFYHHIREFLYHVGHFSPVKRYFTVLTHTIIFL